MNFTRLSRQIYAIVLITAVMAVQVYADGLPGEYYITQRWRDLFSRHSPATNPAFMTEENYASVRGVFSPSLGGTFTLYEAGITYPIGLYQSVGLSVLGVNSSEEIEGYLWDPGTNTFSPTGDSWQDNHTHFMASYAINPWNRLSVGANLIYYQIPNFGDPIQGIALDVGASYRLMNNPVLGEHIIGLSFQNALSPDFEFEELQQQSINAKLSWMGKMWDGRIDAGIDLDFKDFTSLDEYFDVEVVDGQAQLVPGDGSIEFDFNSRIGFWMMQMVNVYGLVGNNYIGLAGGLNVPTVFGGRDFQANYQYISMYEDDNAFAHSVYLRSEIGLHREQKWARRMAERHMINVGDLWRRAMRHYSAGEFWDAMFLFGRITVEYPEFPRNHLATYYIARSQEEMEMRELAMENYNKVLTEFPASQSTVDIARMGLLRLNYREGLTQEVSSQFSELTRSVVADSISNQAYYYMGEQELAQGNTNRAITHFSQVPREHEYYIFAQHSLATAEARNGDFDAVKLHLDNVIQAPLSVEAETYLEERQVDLQREIKNRSYALLGYYYFNNGQYPQAIASLREVDDDSQYYLDALVGKAWSAFKVQNWRDCRNYSRDLIEATDNPVLRAEASVILAYYHMMNDDWDDAVQVLTPMSRALEDFTPPTEEDLADKEEAYYESRTEYFDLANSANRLAQTTYSSYVETQKDSLNQVRESIEETVRAYHRALDELERDRFFAQDRRSIEQLVNYTLGRASEQSTVSEDDDAMRELQDLESEEEELLRQLEMLEQME
ncbi:tetratricopeptide repeat protein [Chitinivibrio alkaliphilus]|uniref:Tetratricopeptide repeat protein n=1 Tax=Chitinivibrio alkaliphilus ACht1 TaxID=1313304 RepID=U7D835_9BACT|nr:tetratricopeptide repeat protein [Chitinivibrio alkaliphilus]ERP31247.1 hypothetical protein CALK_1865 [Chitinivibrio alkaliphilus ACht1]